MSHNIYSSRSLDKRVTEQQNGGMQPKSRYIWKMCLFHVFILRFLGLLLATLADLVSYP